MIKKEFKDILPGVAIRLIIGIVSIIVIMSIIYYTSQRSDGSKTYLLVPFLIQMSIVLIWIANSIGVTAFSIEYRDNAFEYMFSTPLTKFDLLITKIIPRLIVLLSLSIPYIILNSVFLDSDVYSYVPITKPFIFLLTINLIFFCSFFLSLFSWKNIRMVVWIVFVFPMIWMGYIILYLSKYFNITDKKTSSLLITNISLGIISIILGFAFYTVFKKFDIKSEAIHKKKFSIYAGIPLILIVILGVISSVFLYE